jgi:hypothetical protein
MAILLVIQILQVQDSISSSHQEIILLRTMADIPRDMHHPALVSINLIHTSRVREVKLINILPNQDKVGHSKGLRCKVNMGSIISSNRGHHRVDNILQEVLLSSTIPINKDHPSKGHLSSNSPINKDHPSSSKRVDLQMTPGVTQVSTNFKTLELKV